MHYIIDPAKAQLERRIEHRIHKNGGLTSKEWIVLLVLTLSGIFVYAMGIIHIIKCIKEFS